MTLYKSDVVNPTYYRKSVFLSADPQENTGPGLSIQSLGNYFTTTAADYQTYPGAIRF